MNNLLILLPRNQSRQNKIFKIKVNMFRLKLKKVSKRKVLTLDEKKKEKSLENLILR